jgi:hypothetical protein
MRHSLRFASLTAIASILFIVPSSAQKTTGPKAQYTMDVSTTSGMGMAAAMGGGLASLLGGGGGDNYALELRLKSTTPAAQQPEKGDHFFLPAAKMGKSVPLLGDAPGVTERGTPGRDYDPNHPMEKPKGRLLMFWGCHDKAPKGQPFIIDFAKMPTAKMPMGMPGNMAAYQAAAQSRNDNAAWWPNEKSGKQPKSGSSLRGEHRITSAFTPEIKFTLANDYMAGLNVNNSDQAGSVLLGWNAISSATGYSAMAMGGMERAGQGGDMVMWTSANTRDFSGGGEWMAPAEVARQIAAKNVMPPSQTSCNIPSEAKSAAGGMMFGSMNAYGPEENFAFPPKPSDPKAVWNIDWTARARFRAMSSFMVGMGGGGMGGMDGMAQPERKPKPCKGPMGIPIPGTKC